MALRIFIYSLMFALAVHCGDMFKILNGDVLVSVLKFKEVR
jgi:hypothetical protein|tara:strand:+ start:375 stop:497 length:123 start_codon:yes stop_codon:yes gene_type:complete